MRGRVRHGLCVLHVEVRLKTRHVRLEPAVVDLFDVESRVYRIGAKCGHELLQICEARELISVPRDPELILGDCLGGIGKRLVQPAQELRRNLVVLRLAARQHLFQCRLLRCPYCLDRVHLWCLLQRVRGEEDCRRRDSLHVCVQHCGKRIVHCPENGGVVRSSIPVEPERCPEEFVSFEHGHVGEREPVSAVCRRDGGGLHSMVCEPGVNELERAWVWCDKLSDPLL